MMSILDHPPDANATPIRLLIADDNRRARDALRAVLTTDARLQIVGQTDDGREALRLMERHRPQVVVADVRMPGLDGIRLTREIKRRWPETRVVVLTLHPGYEEAARRAGADAFLIKGGSPGSIVPAILGEA
jgi:DNA-binding NarL/FixJ family response regulator